MKRRSSSKPKVPSASPFPHNASWFKRTCVEFFKTVKSWFFSVAREQEILESTPVYKTYSSAVVFSSIIQCFSPLVFRPFAVALVECGWNIVVWSGMMFVASFIKNPRLKLAFQLIINGLRLFGETLTATFNLTGLFIVHLSQIRNKFSHHQRALFYVFFTHLPTTFKALKYIQEAKVLRIENDALIKKYEAVLNMTLNDPYEDVEKHFFVYKNVPHLSQARNIFFAENHTNRTHHELKNLFVASTSQVGDRVLSEGEPSMKFFECSMYKKFHDQISPEKHVYRHEVAESLTCVGWDDIQAQQRGFDVDNDFENFRRAQDSLKFESRTTVLPAAAIEVECERQKEFFKGSSAQSWIDKACAIWKNVFSQPKPDAQAAWNKTLALEDVYYDSLPSLKFADHQQRNRVLIDTDRALSSSFSLNVFGLFKKIKRFGQGHRQFWIIGAAHVLPPSEDVMQRMTQVPTPQDLAFELRQHFESQPDGYAILYPR